MESHVFHSLYRAVQSNTVSNTTVDHLKNETLVSSSDGFSVTQRILIFFGLTVFAIVTNFARMFVFYTICVNASRVLHNKMFASIMRAPIRLFDTNPTGETVNLVPVLVRQEDSERIGQ